MENPVNDAAANVVVELLNYLFTSRTPIYTGLSQNKLVGNREYAYSYGSMKMITGLIGVPH